VTDTHTHRQTAGHKTSAYIALSDICRREVKIVACTTMAVYLTDNRAVASDLYVITLGEVAHIIASPPLAPTTLVTPLDVTRML